jgi:hypothetical protein
VPLFSLDEITAPHVPNFQDNEFYNDDFNFYIHYRQEWEGGFKEQILSPLTVVKTCLLHWLVHEETNPHWITYTQPFKVRMELLSKELFINYHFKVMMKAVLRDKDHLRLYYAAIKAVLKVMALTGLLINGHNSHPYIHPLS